MRRDARVALAQQTLEMRVFSDFLPFGARRNRPPSREFSASAGFGDARIRKRIGVRMADLGALIEAQMRGGGKIGGAGENEIAGSAESANTTGAVWAAGLGWWWVSG